MPRRGARRSTASFTSTRHLVRAMLLLMTGAVALGAAASAYAQQSMLDPKGPNAQRIANLSWLLIGLGTIVFVVVMAFVLIAVFRQRRDDGTEDEAPGGQRFIVGGVLASVAILTIVLVGTFWTLAVLADDEPSGIAIHVVGHQFWWEVRYPDYGVVTANEIHIPVGEPVRLTMTSTDVIHSFWVPELTGKLDLNPNDTNVLTLQADQAGTYRGQCAEFCGLQHALMAFHVVAETPDEFAAWMTRQAQPAAEPSNEIIVRGQEVFLSAACVYCHRVGGTNAEANVGPDLTHFASRQYIAAGTIENNRGNLAGWIVDPQAIKPGNLMPGIDLPPEDLQALLSYLESLE